MNKVILGLILAVCLLGMALVMLNERLGRKNEVMTASTSVETSNIKPVPVDTENWPASSEIPSSPEPATPSTAERALSMEQTEAREALAPPTEAPLVELAPAVPKLPETAPQPGKPDSETVSVPPARVQAPVAPAPVEPARPAAATPKPENRPQTRVENTPEKPVPAKPEKQQPAGKVVNRFVVFARDGGATIRVGSPAQVRFNSMTLENPDRVVVDMDGSWQFPTNPGIPKNEIVNNIRTGKMGEKTRVVIDLKAKPKSVRVIPAKNGDGFDVRVDK